MMSCLGVSGSNRSVSTMSLSAGGFHSGCIACHLRSARGTATPSMTHGPCMASQARPDAFHRVERSYGEFLRSFNLPAFIDANKILAEFKDGLLWVFLPKREEAKPKQIEVNVK